jgi:hypothetical protein
MVVSTMLASAAELALAPSAVRVPEVPSTPDAVLIEAGYRWGALSSSDAQGNPLRVTCLVRAENVSADVMEVPLEDLASIAGELCADLWSSGS